MLHMFLIGLHMMFSLLLTPHWPYNDG